MQDTQSRVCLVNRRVKIRRRRQRDGWIMGLAALCCVVAGLEIGLIAYQSDFGYYHSTERWMYGATMLLSNAGGYVLVALIAFVLAVWMTVFCMKRHEKDNKEEENK